MSAKTTSLLAISPDQAFHDELQRRLSPQHFSLTSKCETVIGMNGSAVRLASSHDIVVFDWDQSDPDALTAARDICNGRSAGSKIIALAGQDLPLVKLRELSRVGVDSILPRDALQNEIVPDIEAWRQRQMAQLPAIWSGQATEGKIIVVAQARGGIGSSTIAVNLADQLQWRSRKTRKAPPCEVALVDFDFQFGSIASLVDVEESEALWRMAMDGTNPDAAYVEQAIVKSASGLSVLTAPPRYGPLSALTAEQIAAILFALKKTHDYIVVDLPRALVDWIEPVLAQADRLLLATDITVPSVRAARKLIDFYLAEHPGLTIEIVATRERKPFIAPSHHKAATELLQLPFRYWVPDDPKAARDALDRGKPLSTVAPHSRVCKAIQSMAGQLMAELPARHAHH